MDDTFGVGLFLVAIAAAGIHGWAYHQIKSFNRMMNGRDICEYE